MATYRYLVLKGSESQIGRAVGAIPGVKDASLLDFTTGIVLEVSIPSDPDVFQAIMQDRSDGNVVLDRVK